MANHLPLTDLNNSLDDLFIAWIYQNKRIGNGDMLILAMENTSNWDAFLNDVGLPSDTEMDF